MHIRVVDDKTRVFPETTVYDRRMVLSVDDEGAAVMRAMEAGLQEQVRVTGRQSWSREHFDEIPKDLLERFKVALVERMCFEAAQAGRAVIAIGPVGLEGPDQVLQVRLVVHGISIPQVKYPAEPR